MKGRGRKVGADADVGGVDRKSEMTVVGGWLLSVDGGREGMRLQGRGKSPENLGMGVVAVVVVMLAVGAVPVGKMAVDLDLRSWEERCIWLRLALVWEVKSWV